MKEEPTPIEPLVSIVTPCLNAGDRLSRCLDSVRQQSYGRIEHIVMDGGSHDQTLDILQSVGGITWISEPDSGQTAAINKGFRLALGDIVGWLNADDALTRDAVHSAVAALQKNPWAGWVYGDNTIAKSGRSYVVRPPRRLSLRHLSVGNPVPQAGALITKWAMNCIGELDESLHFTMDFDLWMRLLKHGIQSVYAPMVLAIVEIHAKSKSGSAPEAAFIRDHVRTWFRNDELRCAAVGLGRLAAHSATRNGQVSRTRLRLEIQRAYELSNLSRRALRGGAKAEAVRIEYGRGLWRVRHLLSLWPWSCPVTRRQILHSAIRKLTSDRFPRAL